MMFHGSNDGDRNEDVLPCKAFRRESCPAHRSRCPAARASAASPACLPLIPTPANSHTHQVEKEDTVRVEYDVMSVDGGYLQNHKRASAAGRVPAALSLTPSAYGGTEYHPALTGSTSRRTKWWNSCPKREHRDDPVILLKQTLPAERPETATAHVPGRSHERKSRLANITFSKTVSSKENSQDYT